tara:strand:- start:4 stop:1224 length:1221 start_codon:yes stop_codon:yes gene_type:complete
LSKLKIAFFTENYYKGGLDTFIISLINNWPNDNDSIELICNDCHPGIETFQSQIRRNFRLRKYKIFNSSKIIEVIKSINVIKLLSKPIDFLIRYPLFISKIISTRKLFLKSNANRLIVINGGYPGGDLCRAATISWSMLNPNKLSIHNFHNIAQKPNLVSSFFENIIDKMINKHSSYLISVSQYSSQSILSRPGFKHTNKLRFVYNGISPLKNICEADLHSEINIDKNDKICSMLGTFEPRKGHKFVLEAFKIVIEKVPEAHLLFAGYGSKKEIENVKDLVNDYGLKKNVHILGFREDKENILLQTEILIIGSQAYESFGYTAIEAMACKIPVVATNVGGLPEVVKDGEGGYCLDYNDVFGYSKKIIELLQNKSLRIEQGLKGYNRYRASFSANQMAKRYYQYIVE